ncbi:hypothetical protein [Halomarina oriensis]|uniref:Uncharacterized protein n=1 Tax=Halomarina oriensis TaxID=671145 RepID=A0A6B0GIV2_9EURY|nr:hypothetical protein [Halomarina oriensis]MWG34684.1 hypothetical protein [Halomarina oriensis]
MDETAVLLADGGSSDENEEQDEETAEESEGGDENQRLEDMSADGVANEDEGTEVLFLDLKGLDLNLLGLDVTLSELVLDVSAVEGDGNLLGNLLSAVTGLLDGGLGSLLDGLALDFDIGERVRSAFESVKENLGDAIDDMPIGEILTQVLTGVITQLLGLDDLMDDSDEESGDSDEDDEGDSDEGNEESEE